MSVRDADTGRYSSKGFWETVDVGPIDECWTWAGGGQKSYPSTTIDGKWVSAPRLMFSITEGYLPNICRHTCDNRQCVNPFHLLDGDYHDNNMDMTMRGRHGIAKITAEDIPVIRQRLINGDRKKSIYEDYGISRAELYKIQTRKTWSWLS